MNADSPHLSLEELLAEANGDAAGERASEHLATCRSCRADTERWAAVAAGVRQLVAATPSPPPWPVGFFAETAPAGRVTLRAARPRGLARTRPHRVLAAAAVAVVAAGGTAYGLTTGLTGGNGRAGTAGAGLTAVTGCAGLDAASGMLEQVNGTSLVVQTPGGRSVTVTTSHATKLARELTGTLTAITDGARVVVYGTGSDGIIAAKNVTVGITLDMPKPPPSPKASTLPDLPGGPKPRIEPPGTPGIASGTVAEASPGRFTLVRSDGTRVQVTTGSATVFTLTAASLSQFRTGGYVIAVGAAGPNGTLAATTVEQGSFLPQIQNGDGISKLPQVGCSSSAVATAALVSAS